MTNPKIKKLPTAQPLTEEQKKAQVLQYLAQKREQYASNILYNLCSSIPKDFSNHDCETLVDVSVEMADRLMEKLYPIPKDDGKGED